MRIHRLVWTALFLTAAVTALAAERTAAFRVDGMNTDEEVRRVTASLNRTPGVSESVGDPRSQVVMVKYNDAKTKAADLAEAVDIAGFTLSPLESKDPKDQAKAKAAAVLGDFNAVMGQTRQAMDKERFGLVRSLALAMKVRRDAVVTLTQGVATPTAQIKGKPAPPVAGPNAAFGQQLSKAVDAFAAAAESRDKVQAKALYSPVKQAFRKLIEAYDLDSLVAAPTAAPAPSKDGKTAPQKEKSLSDQLKDLGGKYF